MIQFKTQTQSLMFVLSIIFTLLCLNTGLSEEQTPRLFLWLEGAPGKLGNEEIDQPWMWVYTPDPSQACGTAMVICPGGGYAVHAVDHEGVQVARWLNRIGITAFVLKYRLAPRYAHPAPLQDVRRALQLVRARAAEFGVQPHRIGVMGFSAGGHLASCAATIFVEGDPQAEDVVSRVSSRPDFAVLAYPVISMLDNWGHAGSRRNLLGEQADPKDAQLLSTHLQVTERTPPVFLFHTAEDRGVPVENSVAFFTACRNHNVPAEMHIFQEGPHGVGLAPGHPTLHIWTNMLHSWMKNSGFLCDVTRAAVRGEVLDAGQPLRWGQIRFVPQNPHAPIAFAMIRQGRFSLSQSQGPAVGPNRVEIITMGDVAPHPTAEDATLLVADPAEVTIQPGENQVRWQVHTVPKPKSP